MRNKLSIIGAFILGILPWNPLPAQQNPDSGSLPCRPETILVHWSHASCFAGDVCWFSLYCSSPLLPHEGLSSLAFVELVSPENLAVIRQKILLEKGIGNGEMQIPATLPTGIYYLSAYTSWMKNFGEGSFFREPVVIINPEQAYHNPAGDIPSTSFYADSSRGMPGDSGVLRIRTDKIKYGTREKVSLEILTKTQSGSTVPGIFSVSVYRKEPPMAFETHLGQGIADTSQFTSIRYWPDFRGICLTGRLTDLAGSPVRAARILVSEPGPGTDIKSDITDNTGTFHFLLRPKTGEQDLVISRPDINTKTDLEESFWNGFRKAPHGLMLELNSTALRYLDEKFAHFQLQGRFRKQSRVQQSMKREPVDSSVFYAKPYQLLKMNNYVNMDSLREYFYELVPSVRFNEHRGELAFTVTDPETQLNLEEKPGVFLDGVWYDNYAGMAALSVKDIDRMNILPETYYYKDLTFGGIIDIHTKKSDFNEVPLLPNMTRMLYPLADSCEWTFRGPDYSLKDSIGRIPDFRYLLDWQSGIRIGESGNALLRFYTGDVKGTFVIRVEGMSDKGQLMQSKYEIQIGD